VIKKEGIMNTKLIKGDEENEDVGIVEEQFSGILEGQVCECCPAMATEESFKLFYCETCYRIGVLHFKE